MVALYAQLQKAEWDLTRTRAVYHDYLNAAFRLEDVLDHARSSQVFWRSSIRWLFILLLVLLVRLLFLLRSFAPKRLYCGGAVIDKLESFYYRYIEQIALKVLALFCALLSAGLLPFYVPSSSLFVL